jgi:transcriptional regulator with XRE-family HTH domain
LTADIPTSSSETVGERLRRLRLERGLSQRELSAPGVSYAYISRIEAGARRPSVKALRSLARKLGVSAEYLETGSEIGETQARELRLADAELRIRLDEPEAPIADLEAILAESTVLGDEVSATRARIALGLAAARRGDNAGAVRHLEQSLESDLVAPSSRPDVYSTLGRAYADGGEPRKAVELFERGLDDTLRDAPDDRATHVRFATYLSFALTDSGELDRARNVVQDALDRGAHDADPYTRVRLYWSLGRIAHEQSKPLVALEHFRRAVALLEATEDTLHLARAHLSVAGAAIVSGETDDVEQQIAVAEHLLGPRPEPGDLAALRRMQAELAIQRGDATEAVRRAQESIAASSDFPNHRGLALAVLAGAQALQGDPAAEATFRSATALLIDHGTPRERGDVLRAHARYLRSQGRESDALDVLERLADLGSVAAR